MTQVHEHTLERCAGLRTIRGF